MIIFKTIFKKNYYYFKSFIFILHRKFSFINLHFFFNYRPPISFCYEIFKGNVTVSNFTCHDMSLFNFCQFGIQKLLTDGTYQLGIYLGNDVTEVRRVIQIKVFPGM